jgi:hypothetical protein
MWLHSSPAKIAVGTYVIPACAVGVSRTFPGGMEEADLRWYEPSKVYVLESGSAPPSHQVGRWAFSPRSSYLYEVEPEGLGPDLDLFNGNMSSATCDRALVLSVVHAPADTHRR